MSTGALAAQHLAAEKQRADARAASGDDVDGIRRVEAGDLRVVRQLIGQSVMEGLAEANKQTYFHPAILPPYMILATILDYRLGWVPNPDIWWSYATPLIGFAALALPILFIVEMLNRSYFESLLRLTLGALDLVQPLDYYACPGSGLYVLLHHSEIIGVVAIDASERAGRGLESVIPGDDARQGDLAVGWARKILRLVTLGPANVMKAKSVDGSKGTSTATSLSPAKTASFGRNRKQGPSIPVTSSAPTASSRTGTAHIRHLYIEPVYRRHHCATDLINHALAHTFAASTSPAIKRAILRCPGSATGGARRALAQLGFDPVNRLSEWAASGATEKQESADSGSPRIAPAQGWLADENRKIGWISLPGSEWVELKWSEWEKEQLKQG